MTVKDFITKLLDCPMDAHIVVQKELDDNIWINSNVIISDIDRETVTLSFDFPSENYKKKKKNL